MRIGFLGAIIAATVSVSGCAYKPSNTTGDHGPAPTDYQASVMRFMEDVLKDPMSAQYSNWRGPTAGWQGGLLVETTYGWLVCADVNAKNSFGGYTGAEIMAWMIKHDRVIWSKRYECPI